MPNGPQFQHDCTNKSPGQTCTVGCAPDFDGEDVEFTCEASLSFSGTLPTCTPIGCTSNLPSGALYQHDCDGKIAGQTCTVSCLGDDSITPTTLSCEASTIFSGTLPDCAADFSVVTGTVTLTVDDPEAFVANPQVKETLARAIAVAANVDPAYVEVDLQIARRLDDGLVAGSVVASYIISFPPSAEASMNDVTAELSTMTDEDFSAAITTAFEEDGLADWNPQVESVSVPEVQKSGEDSTSSTEDSTTVGRGDASAASSLRPAFILVLKLFVAFVVVAHV